MRRSLIPTLAAALFLSSACVDRREVTELDAKLARVEAEVTTLKATVDNLERQRSIDDLWRNIESIACLTPGSNGYSIVQMDLGRLTVKLQNVEPYANGSGVTLQFGNLMSATVNGAKAMLEWGSVDEKGAPKPDTTRDHAK